MAMTGGTSKLVKTGYADYGKDGAINLYVYYRSTQDVATNKSTVYVGMYVTTPSASYDIGAWTDSRGSYVGTTSNTFNGSIPNFKGTRWLVENKTFTVQHNDDGTAKATIYWKWGVNSPWGQMVAPSGSFEITLPQIARASTITSASNATLGSTTTIKWTPKSKSFYYKVKLAIGTWSTTTNALHPNTTSAYPVTLSVPYDIANQLASNAKVGTVTATLYTYSDSACTKQVGSADTETFSVTVPDNSTTKPSVTLSVAPVNASGKSWSNLYVQGVSKVQATITATGRYGATISSRRMELDGKSYTDLTSGVITTSGTRTVYGYSTDSREFTGYATQTINVIPYAAPRILAHSSENGIVCARCKADDTLDESGTYLRIKAKLSYFKLVSNGTAHNQGGLFYRWKKANGTYTDWSPLIDYGSAVEEVAVTIDDIYLDPTSSYAVQLGAKDSVQSNYIYETFTIPTADVDFNMKDGGGGAAFGKYAERANALEIADDWDLVMKGEAVADFVIEQGTSGIWTYRKWNSGNVEAWCLATNINGAYADSLEVPSETYLNFPFDIYSAQPHLSLTGNHWEVKKYYANTVTDKSVKIICYTEGNLLLTDISCAVHIDGRWK